MITNDFEKIKGCTVEYFVNLQKHYPFKTVKDRIKAEYYTIGRTLLKLMLNSI